MSPYPSRSSFERGAPPAHPPSIAVEQFAFGPQDAKPDQSTVDHIQNCPECSLRVRILREEREAFRVMHPSSTFLARLERAQSPDRSRVGLGAFRAALSAVALASALGVTVFMAIQPSDEANVPAGVKMKGTTELALRIHVSRDGAPAVPFDERDELHRGDILRFVADIPEDGYAALMSLDENQRLSWYYPTSAYPARLLTAGTSRVLPGAIQLDDYVGSELLVLVLSDAPMDKQAIETHVRKAMTEAKGDLQVLHRRGFGASSVSLLLRKGRSR